MGFMIEALERPRSVGLTIFCDAKHVTLRDLQQIKTFYPKAWILSVVEHAYTSFEPLIPPEAQSSTVWSLR